MRLLATALLAVTLQHCSGTACPPLKQYSKEFLAAAATEYDRVEKDAPHLVRLVDDYGITRDAIRVCLRATSKQK